MNKEMPKNLIESEKQFEFGLCLGSTSAHKLEALKEACLRIGLKTEIKTALVESDINMQPYGFEETYQGALNRAKHTQAENPKSLAIGLENGIIAIKDKFVDVAVIVVLMPNNQEFVGTSVGIEFPKEAVETARVRGFHITTVGSVIAETMGGSGTDPHSTLTHGKVSRKEILVDAISAVLSRVLFKE